METETVGHKILIVEDDKSLRKLLTDYLNDHGFCAVAAGSGAEALWMIAREKPEVVVLDLMLPEMPGEHVCRLIKSDPSLSNIIVFILSAKEDLETRLDCLRMGAEEYLLKPIDMEELSVRLQRFLSFAARSKPVGIPAEERTMTIDMATPTEPRLETPSHGTVAMTRPKHSREKSKYGSYRVERLVGKGGMGHVYKAYDEHLDRFVALKVLAKQWTDSAEFVARFRREAKLLASVSHPGIAQIYSLAEDNGEYYFALLWCPGGSLRDVIRNQRTIGLMKAVDIMLQCSRALAAAWQKGVVHRDVKPSNIMFDENQQIKIVDFGIAHSEKISTQLTAAQEILGSPAYMAPEQARAERVDHRADIYALGMTFYQMLSGELPYSAKTPVEWMVKHATEAFPPFHKIEGKIPQKAYRILENMTRKDPMERYESYTDLISDLETMQMELFRERQFKVPSATHVSRLPTVQGEHIFDVLMRILKTQQSGVLKTRWGPLEKKFYIVRGDAVLFESPQVEENVWKKLSENGTFDATQVSLINTNLEETLNRLLFLQLLSMDDFVICYRQLMKNALLEVFRWPVVEVEYYNAEITEESFCKISLRSLLMDAARTIVDYESIRTQVPADRFIVRTPEFDKIFSILELPATESFLASRIEGESVTLEVLQMLTGFPQEQIRRFVYVLKCFGAIEYKSLERRKAARTQTSVSPDSLSVDTNLP